MGVVFLFIGIAAIAIGVRGQSKAAGALLASEFTGANSFVEWLAAITILGVIGFYRPVRPAANAMLGLVILAMFIRKGVGFFSEINQAITSATAAPKPPSSVGAASGASVSSPAGAGTQQPGASGATNPATQPLIPSLPNLPGGAGSITNQDLTDLENMLGFGPSTDIGKSILNGLNGVGGFFGIPAS